MPVYNSHAKKFLNEKEDAVCRFVDDWKSMEKFI
jgi:hypothetical protein